MTKTHKAEIKSLKWVSNGDEDNPIRRPVCFATRHSEKKYPLWESCLSDRWEGVTCKKCLHWRNDET